LCDFVFDQRFQKNEHDTERGLDSDLILADSDPAVYTRSFEMDMVTLPTVVDFKFSGQIVGQFICRLLCFLGGHGMVGAHINMRHRDSLDATLTQRQYGFSPDAG